MAMLVGHLDYYTRHGLNPVRYDTTDLKPHFERRGSLYRTLGITPLAIRGSRVLEVAPGTGQNSLYLACQNPASLTLVEPNPIARRDIAAVYAQAGTVCVTPEVVPCLLEDFDPECAYDLVVCENWLGDSDHERGLLRKLGTLVAPGGLLVVTTVSPVGVLPNLLRRALANRLAPAELSFEVRTDLLCQAFGPHLRTVGAMTRTVTDWVHDTVMNPAYLGVVLPIPVVVSELGDTFDVLGSSPRFGTDWRWFKSLCGTNREFNQHVLAQYTANLHNFADHRTLLPPRSAVRNAELESAALSVLGAIRSWEAGESEPDGVEIAVRQFMMGIADLPADYTTALDEFLDAFADPTLTPEVVAALPHFASLFGRETIYLSLEKRN